jgi:intein/homing endonuclease
MNIFGAYLSGKTLLSLQEVCYLSSQLGGDIALFDVDGSADIFVAEWQPIFEFRYNKIGRIHIVPSFNVKHPAQKYLKFDLKLFEHFGVKARVELSEGGKAAFIAYGVCESLAERLYNSGARYFIVDSFSQMYKDSVPSYTSVIVETEEGINVTTIEDLWNEITTPAMQINEREMKTVSGLKCFSPTVNQFVEVKAITRHWYKGKLIRIMARGGCVDVTPTHSIYVRRPPLGSKDGGSSSLIDAREVKVGDKVILGNYAHLTRGRGSPMFVGRKELAWLWGFFTAEGCCHYGKDGVYYVVLGNKSKHLIEKAQNIIGNEIQGCRTYVRQESDGTYRLDFGSKRIYMLLKRLLYTTDGMKRVPECILNAPVDVQEEFLKGFIDGDGCRSVTSNPVSFAVTNTSHVLLEGILYLVKKLKNLKHRLNYYQSTYGDAVDIWFSDVERKRRDEVMDIREIDYEGWVYDFTTATGDFAAGIGMIKVHNTFPSVSSFGERARAEDMLYSLVKMFIAEHPDTLFILNHHISINPMTASIDPSGGSAVIQNSKLAMMILKRPKEPIGKLYVYRHPHKPPWSESAEIRFTDAGVLDNV